jgi:energy-coupling factor transport system substrate-specific component
MGAFALYVTIFLGLFILASYFKLNEMELHTKDISFIAIFTAFTSIMRVPFVVLPNVQPCSYLIFCAGYVFGPFIGFVIGGLTAVISNIFLGQGPWTLYEMIGWGFIGIVGGLINRRENLTPNRYLIAILGLILGFIYGWITNLWSFFILNAPSRTWAAFLSINILSIPFDIAHGLSNFVFLLYFGPRTINILYRYRHRFRIIFLDQTTKDIKLKVESQIR